jgi:hypothetical protein
MPPDDENVRTPASRMQAQRRCARGFVPGARRAGRPRRFGDAGVEEGGCVDFWVFCEGGLCLGDFGAGEGMPGRECVDEVMA